LVTFEQWQWLITGVDWQRLSAVPSANWPNLCTHLFAK
jgi:hypothetical protein